MKIQTNQTNKKGFLQLITSTGSQVFRLLFWLVIFGLLLQFCDNYFLQPKCRQESNTNQQSWECSLASPLIGGLGSNFLQAAVTIFVLDIGLKRKTLEEIQGIINNAKPTRYLKEFFRSKKDYNDLISRSFESASPGQEIRILCLFEEEIVIFTGSQDLRNIRDKIVNGCKLKFLILHPESSLVDFLDQSGLTRKDNFRSISDAFLSKLDTLYKHLETQYHHKGIQIKGSLEVKFYKNLFSPIGYYSDSKDYRIAWMYFSHSQGSEYPAFHIGGQDLINDTDQHFEYLWQQAGNLLIKITHDPANSFNHIPQVGLSSNQSTN